MNKLSNNETKTRLAARYGVALVSIAALAGCAVNPKPLSGDEIATRINNDRAKMFADQAPVAGPISLAEASARAIKFNLDARLKIMEEALAVGQLDVSRWDMFPRLLANAGYVNRSNDLSYVTAGGIPSTTTLDRNRRLSSIEFSWNLLDFGASYYRAKMASDQVLVAEERKRKAVQNLMQDVRTAYWRALGAQRLVNQVDGLMQKSKTALARARQIEQQGLLPQAQALAYQRALLDSTVLLQNRRQDLELAKIELASLMNLAPGSDFTLTDGGEPTLPGMPSNVPQLEEQALAQRPELREEDYRKRISANDARRAIMATLPNLSLSASRQYDSNRFLLNNSWVESALQLSMSLFKMASIPALNRQRDAQLAVDDTRRMAQAMAALTQVRVAVQRYGLARDELDQVSASADVDQRLANYARSAATSRVDSELEVIRTEARALLSKYQRSVAYANAQAAHGRLYNSLGLDINTPKENADLGAITRSVEESLAVWQRTAFESEKRSDAPLPKVQVVIAANQPAAQAQAIRSGAETALGRYEIAVTNDPSAWKMEIAVRTELDQNNKSRAALNMILRRPDGSFAGKTIYTAIMPDGAKPEMMSSLTQASIDAYSQVLVESMSMNRVEAVHGLARR